MEITIHGNETPVQLMALSRCLAEMAEPPTGAQHFTAHTEVNPAPVVGVQTTAAPVEPAAQPRGRGRPPKENKALTEQVVKETLQKTEQVIEKIEQEKAQQPAETTKPEPAADPAAPKATKDDVTKALEQLRDTFETEGIGKVRSLLQELGFNKISELPEDKYGDVIAAAQREIAAKKAA